MVNYTWEITQFRLIPNFNNLNNVISDIGWVLIAEKEYLGKKYTTDYRGSISIPSPSEQNFISYDQISFEQSLEWLHSELTQDRINTFYEELGDSLDSMIERDINPPYIDVLPSWIIEKNTKEIDSFSIENITSISPENNSDTRITQETSEEPIEPINPIISPPIININPIEQPIESVDQPAEQPIESAEQPAEQPIESVDQPAEQPIESVDQPAEQPIESVEENTTSINPEESSSPSS